MSKLKDLAILAGVGIAGYAGYLVITNVQKTISDIQQGLTAPFTALGQGISGVQQAIGQGIFGIQQAIGNIQQGVGQGISGVQQYLHDTSIHKCITPPKPITTPPKPQSSAYEILKAQGLEKLLETWTPEQITQSWTEVEKMRLAKQVYR